MTPKPKIRIKVGRTTPQVGVLADAGFIVSTVETQCWTCPRFTNKRKPGTVYDIWKCDWCQVTWQQPTAKP